MTIYWKYHSPLHQVIADGNSDLSFVQDTLEYGDMSPDYSTEGNFTLLMAACCKVSVQRENKQRKQLSQVDLTILQELL